MGEDARVYATPSMIRDIEYTCRDLIMDPDHEPKRVATALTGLSVAPELFDTPANIYLGLKQARTSLDHARNDADLLDVAALLWAMAQQLENGDATQAQPCPERRM